MYATSGIHLSQVAPTDTLTLQYLKDFTSRLLGNQSAHVFVAHTHTTYEADEAARGCIFSSAMRPVPVVPTGRIH